MGPKDYKVDVDDLWCVGDDGTPFKIISFEDPECEFTCTINPGYIGPIHIDKWASDTMEKYDAMFKEKEDMKENKDNKKNDFNVDEELEKVTGKIFDAAKELLNSFDKDLHENLRARFEEDTDKETTATTIEAAMNEDGSCDVESLFVAISSLDLSYADLSYLHELLDSKLEYEHTKFMERCSKE